MLEGEANCNTLPHQTIIFIAKNLILSVKKVKIDSQQSCEVMCHFNFFSSTFSLTLDRENDAYTLLNPNPTHKNNSKVRAKVEEKKLKWHMICT
jgi:hypothetical protein